MVEAADETGGGVGRKGPEARGYVSVGGARASDTLKQNQMEGAEGAAWPLERVSTAQAYHA